MALIAAVPVGDGGHVGRGWGRADRVAVAGLASDGTVATWAVRDVGWGALHPRQAGPGPAPLTLGPVPAAGGPGPGRQGAGSHHARIVRFLRDEGVGLVVVEHMGEGMRRTLAAMGVPVALGAGGDARAAVESAAALLAHQRAEAVR